MEKIIGGMGRTYRCEAIGGKGRGYIFVREGVGRARLHLGIDIKDSVPVTVAGGEGAVLSGLPESPVC
jgi:hypothetical protein